MLNEATEKALKESELLFRKLGRFDKFVSKYNVSVPGEAQRISEGMNSLADSLIDNLSPQNQDELINTELKRRLKGEASHLFFTESGKLYDFDSVVNYQCIPKEDIESLNPWLKENKEKTREAVERLYYSRDLEGYELPLNADVASVRRQAEEFAGAHIQRYHKTLGKFLESLTKVGGYLREINAVPTARDRSYFQPLNNTLAISIGAICYSKDDNTLHIRDEELIRLYGHEGMGHALNFVVTNSNGLPYFLQHPSSLTKSTAESVAQFYENILLEDLKKSPETQKALGIEHKFAEIYQEAKDTEQLKEYNNKIYQYAIKILGDKSLGEPQDPKVLERKVEIICDSAIDKRGIKRWIERNRYNFDSENNLNQELVSELIYCARPVQRALEEFAKKGIYYDEKGRSLIDSTLLKGLWTPIGFVDNARLRAEGK